MFDEEKFADEFDLDLFRLIEKANGVENEIWDSIACKLCAARFDVRRRMSKKDREAT